MRLNPTQHALRLARVWNSLLPCLTSGWARRSRSLLLSNATALSSNGIPKASRFDSTYRVQTSPLATGARSPQRLQQSFASFPQHHPRALDQSRLTGEMCGGVCFIACRSQKAR